MNHILPPDTFELPQDNNFERIHKHIAQMFLEFRAGRDYQIGWYTEGYKLFICRLPGLKWFYAGYLPDVDLWNAAQLLAHCLNVLERGENDEIF